MNENAQLVSMILQGISALAFTCFLFILNGFRASLDSIKVSVGDLNTNIATLLEKDRTKDLRLEQHSRDIASVESEVKNIREKMHDINDNIGGVATLNKIDIEVMKKEIDNMRN